MDNTTKHARKQKYDKYKAVIDDHTRANPGVDVTYQIFAFGTLGAIPKQFEPILQEITPDAVTDWLVIQIHCALISYDAAIWIVRDKTFSEQ